MLVCHITTFAVSGDESQLIKISVVLMQYIFDFLVHSMLHRTWQKQNMKSQGEGVHSIADHSKGKDLKLTVPLMALTLCVPWQAVQQCCKILRERMTPIKAKYPDADWPTLCRKALDAKVDLGARYT